MANIGTVVIELDADVARLVEGVRRSTDRMTRLQRATLDTEQTIKNFIQAFAGLYVVQEGLALTKNVMQDFLDTASEFEQYKNRMSAFTTSLEENNSEMAKAKAFAVEYNLEINKTTDALLLMKNNGLKDTTEQLKIYTNTAIGGGKSIDQFAEAMADALTGENERLKEFGVKASVVGDQISYAWSDSSGKVRNITIKNNKDMIDSTLSAIFNEKYVGQLEAYESSWAGTMQGLDNKWTNFKLQLADNGLIDYFKNVGSVISDYLTTGFADGSNGAEVFAQNSISFLNGVAQTVGFLAKLINQVFGTLEIAYAGYNKLVGFVGGGDIGKLKNEIIELNRVKKENDFGLFSNQNSHIVNNNIKALEKKIKKYKEYNAIRRYGDQTLEKSKKRIINTNKQIEEFTKRIVSPKKINIGVTGVDKLKKQKDKAKKYLTDIGAGYGALGDNATKSGKKTKAGAKAHTKALKDALKAEEDYRKGSYDAYVSYLELTGKQDEASTMKLGNKLNKLGKYLSQAQISEVYQSELRKMQGFTSDFTNEFKSLFKGILDGDIASAFGSFFSNVSSKMMNPMIESFSKSMNSVLSDVVGDMGISTSFIGGIGLSLGANLLKGLLSSESIDSFSQIQARTSSDNKTLSSSISMLAGIDKSQLDYTKKMSESLDKMNDNFIKIGLNITGSKGIDYTGSAFIGSTSSNLWGGKTTSLEGAGLQFDTTSFKDALTDMEIYGYQQIKTIKKSWFGISTATDTVTKLTKAGDNLRNSFIESINYGVDTIGSAMSGLSLDPNILDNALKNTQLDIGKISLEGKSSEEISKYLSSLLGEQLDKLSQATFASLSEFNKAGEGYLETAIRVSSGVERGSKALDDLGISMVEYSSLANKQGNVYTELIRDSIVAYEDTSKGISDIVKGFDKSGDELLAIYSKLEDTQSLLRHLSKGFADVTQSMIDGAGDIDTLQGAFNSYKTNFLSEEEQYLLQRKDLEKEFQALGFSLPQTIQDYKNLINAQDLTTSSGQELYGSLIILNDGMKTFADENEKILTKINSKYKTLAKENETNFITQIKNLINFENEKTKIIRDSQRDILSSFSSLKQETKSFLDNWAGGAKTDELSYKFYAKRYNALKSELSNFVDENGRAKAGIDYTAFKDTYSSLQTIANNLKESSASNPLLDANTSIVSDMNKYLDIFTNQEEMMKVIISGDELGLARDEQVGKLDSILKDVASLSTAGNLTSDDINSSILKLMGVSEELGQNSTFVSLGNAIVNFNSDILGSNENIETALSEIKKASTQSLSLEEQRQLEIDKSPLTQTKKWARPSSNLFSTPTTSTSTYENGQEEFNNNLQYFADGGIVSRPTMGVVGEAGYPEAIIPMRNGKDVPVSINNSKLEKKLDDLIHITIQQAQEIQRMRKEIRDMNERSA